VLEKTFGAKMTLCFGTTLGRNVASWLQFFLGFSNCQPIRHVWLGIKGTGVRIDGSGVQNGEEPFTSVTLSEFRLYWKSYRRRLFRNMA
ncbi:hypothetical protein Ancab_031412, partial [Ancistrocladus abbreviatus]